MHALAKFPLLKHLAVHVGMDHRSMPLIENEQNWLNFIGSYCECVSSLKSLYCNDDEFLRCMKSLTKNRNLGNNLTFIHDNNDSMLIKNNYPLKPIQTDSDDESINAINNLGGHFKRIMNNNDDQIMTPLQYIRYQCQFAPQIGFTGIEFEGAKILELAPYESMFITLPQSIYSFRIASGGRWNEEPDEYKMIVPYTNNIHELCICSIEFSLYSYYLIYLP